MASEVMINLKVSIVYIVITLIVITIIASSLVFVRSMQADTDTTSNTTISSTLLNSNEQKLMNLYAKAVGFSTNSLEERIAAAKYLASHKKADSWIALLLLDSQLIRIDRSLDKYDIERQLALRPFELAVTVATIRSLPEKPGYSTLWALTSLLGEEGKGRWSSKSGFLLTRKIVEYGSPPIREMARDFLKNSLEIDCEWNAIAWREAILTKANKIKHGEEKKSGEN